MIMVRSPNVFFFHSFFSAPTPQSNDSNVALSFTFLFYSSSIHLHTWSPLHFIRVSLSPLSTLISRSITSFIHNHSSSLVSRPHCFPSFPSLTAKYDSVYVHGHSAFNQTFQESVNVVIFNLRYIKSTTHSKMNAAMICVDINMSK